VGPSTVGCRQRRVRYETADDAEALAAFQTVCRLEGIIPRWRRLMRSRGCWPAREAAADASVLVCLSGRGTRTWPRASILGRRRDRRPERDDPATSQVSELIQSLVKALRAFQMYLPTTRCTSARPERPVGFTPYAGARRPRAAGGETDFIWEEQVVYHSSPRREPGLDAVQGRDAVAHLRKGVEEEEIVRFLEVVNVRGSCSRIER